MAEVKLKTFYPANGPTDAAEMNANNSALEGSLGGISGINQQNMRAEGIDRRNISQNLIVAAYGRLNNGYLINLGVTAAAGARYDSYSLDTSVRERPINHDSSGATSTAPGDGTKLRVVGTAGYECGGNELIRVNANINLWSNAIHTPVAELVTKLIDTTTKDGGSGATYPYGSGIGEWCWLVYPKFNVTSNALNDADFQTAYDAGLVDGLNFLDPTTFTGSPPSIANRFEDFEDKRWDHVTVIPENYFAASDVGNSPTLMINSSPAMGNDNDRLGGPQIIKCSFAFKVRNDVAAGKRLYGVQWYCSGYWRMHGQSAGVGIGDKNCGMFLEGDICDPSRTNSGGDPIPLYGVEGQLHLERCQTSIIIHRTMGA